MEGWRLQKYLGLFWSEYHVRIAGCPGHRHPQGGVTGDYLPAHRLVEGRSEHRPHVTYRLRCERFRLRVDQPLHIAHP